MRLHKLLLGSTMLLPAMGSAAPASAQAVGRIALQGRVLARAQVIMPITPISFVPQVASSATTGSGARFTLGSLVNTASGVTVKLASDNPAANNAPALTADDGTVLPYEVTVNGEAVKFSDGEAALATLARGQASESTEVQFVAPKTGEKQPLTDHLVLVVTAR